MTRLPRLCVMPGKALGTSSKRIWELRFDGDSEGLLLGKKGLYYNFFLFFEKGFCGYNWKVG